MTTTDHIGQPRKMVSGNAGNGSCGSEDAELARRAFAPGDPVKVFEGLTVSDGVAVGMYGPETVYVEFENGRRFTHYRRDC